MYKCSIVNLANYPACRFITLWQMFVQGYSFVIEKWTQLLNPTDSRPDFKNPLQNTVLDENFRKKPSIERQLNSQSNDTNCVASACLQRKPTAFEVQSLSAHHHHQRARCHPISYIFGIRCFNKKSDQVKRNLFKSRGFLKSGNFSHLTFHVF